MTRRERSLLLAEIEVAIDNAESKHPIFAEQTNAGFQKGMNLISEEYLEAVTAWNDGEIGEARRELLDTIAVAARMVEMLGRVA